MTLKLKFSNEPSNSDGKEFSHNVIWCLNLLAKKILYVSNKKLTTYKNQTLKKKKKGIGKSLVLEM